MISMIRPRWTVQCSKGLLGMYKIRPPYKADAADYNTGVIGHVSISLADVVCGIRSIGRNLA